MKSFKNVSDATRAAVSVGAELRVGGAAINSGASKIPVSQRPIDKPKPKVEYKLPEWVTRDQLTEALRARDVEWTARMLELARELSEARRIAEEAMQKAEAKPPTTRGWVFKPEFDEDDQLLSMSAEPMMLS